MNSLRLGLLVVIAVFFTVAGCGTKGAGTLPLVTPPVKAATPAGLKTTRVEYTHDGRTLDSSEFRSRFFSSGPTNIFQILTDIDTRISDINTRTTSTTTGCTAATPTQYAIAPWGQSITMYASCYETVGTATTANPGLIQWGTKDGVFYLYTAIGAARVAAIATPIASTSNYRVQAWIGVGYTNQGGTCGTGVWDGCSYGIVQIDANSNTNTFEMAVAGIGFGYCGAQLKSDGTNIYASGSTDMGATCNASDTLCVQASSLTTASTCTAPLTTFTDTTQIGRVSKASSGAAGTIPATWGASTYPAAGNITLDGTATDALYFGPSTPTTGVTRF